MDINTALTPAQMRQPLDYIVDQKVKNKVENIFKTMTISSSACSRGLSLLLVSGT